MVKKEDLKMFISESEDLIQQIEDSILLLERKPRSKKPIKNLFFAFHTIKGLTGMVGLDSLSRFCHLFETFLEKNKESKKALKNPEEFIDFLFEGLDVLRTMVNQSKAGELVDLDTQFLNEIGKTFEDFEKDYEITFIDLLSSDEIKSLPNDKKNKFYKIYVRIQASCIFKKVRLFIIFRAFNKIGRIVFSNPKPNLLEKGQFENDFEIYFLTHHSTDELIRTLEEILEIESHVITELSSAQFLDTVSKPHLEKPIRDAQPAFERIAPQIEEISMMESPEEGAPSYDDSVEIETKITSIKVDIETLEQLMNLFGELVIVKNQVNQILKERQVWEVNRLFDNMDKHFLEIQEVIFQLKLVRVGSIFRRYRRLVRDLAKEHEKEVNLILEGMDVEVDRKILEELSSPIIHLLRNAVYHGIESPKSRKISGKNPISTLRLRTFRQAGSIYIEVEDDGKGIDYGAIRQKLIQEENYSPEEINEFSEETLIQHILMPGFTTLSDADMTSGRGMGLAIVKEKIRELSGSFQIISKPNLGTKIVLNVPFTRAILKAQLIEVSGDLFAIPMENIKQIYTFDRKSIEYVKGNEFYRVESKLIPIIRLSDYFGLKINITEERTPESDTKIAIWCVKDETNSAILIVDNVKQQLEVVVKPFRSKYSDISGISGVTITGDGSICLILDIPELILSKIEEAKELLIAETA